MIINNIDYNINDVILDLYEICHNNTACDFKSQCFSILQEVINFDAISWATWSTKAKVLSQLSYNYVSSSSSREFIIEQTYFLNDAQSQLMKHHNSKQFSPSLVKYTPQKTSITQCNFDHAISAKYFDKASNTHSMITLYKHAGLPSFTDDERLTQQLLMPHTIEAYKFHLHQKVLQNKSNINTAACDATGTIHFCDKKFIDTLKTEFPSWKPPELPPSICTLLDLKRPNVYSGKHIVITIQPQNELYRLNASIERRNTSLSNSERLVTKYLIQGLTYKEVARNLSISPSTVTNHVNNIYRKLEIKNKTELSKCFIQQSLNKI